jgi:hypothetical protein
MPDWLRESKKSDCVHNHTLRSECGYLDALAHTALLSRERTALSAQMSVHAASNGERMGKL